MSGRIVTINHEAEGPFATLAAETWLRVTDDHVTEVELGDWPEFYYRAGMLSAFQLILVASQDPTSARAQAVIAAMNVAGEMLGDDD